LFNEVYDGFDDLLLSMTKQPVLKQSSACILSGCIAKLITSNSPSLPPTVQASIGPVPTPQPVEITPVP